MIRALPNALQAETQAALTFPPRFLNIQGNSSSHSWVSL